MSCCAGGDQVFHYTRGKGAYRGPACGRLRSIGVGGHISADDANLFESPYREAMFREVAEEVCLESAYEERCLGLINDDSTPVGQVHLGIVHVFELAEPKVRRRERRLTRAGFAPIAELREQREEFETWSQFVLDVPGLSSGLLLDASYPVAAMTWILPRRPETAQVEW